MLAARIAKRRAERRWRSSGSSDDKSTLRVSSAEYKKAINKAKKDHLNVTIANARNKSKEIFRALKSLEAPLTSASSFCASDDDCIWTQTHFKNKILKARDKITLETKTPRVDTERPAPPDLTGAQFSFPQITEGDLLKALSGLHPSAGCGDPLPSRIVLDNLELFTPFLLLLVNASFSTGHIPDNIKTVRVTPILKKIGADPVNPTNLRPITGVNLLLKILDRVAIYLFQTYLESLRIFHPRQSGFRPGLSTETALLDIQNSTLKLLDRGGAGLLVFLDLSAAFDLLDHELLLDALKSRARCSPIALDWFRSFLTGRKSSVCWGRDQRLKKTSGVGSPKVPASHPRSLMSISSPYLSYLMDWVSLSLIMLMTPNSYWNYLAIITPIPPS